MCSFLFVLIFPEAAPEHANWDDSKVQSKLRSDIDSHVELLKITMVILLSLQPPFILFF